MQINWIENTLLIVIGFSFSDEHILEITKRALRNPTLKLVIFCHESKGVDVFKDKFLTFNNVDIVHSEKSDVSFSKACLFIQDVLQMKNMRCERSSTQDDG
jgi:hypothetical protein